MFLDLLGLYELILYGFRRFGCAGRNLGHGINIFGYGLIQRIHLCGNRFHIFRNMPGY